MRIFEVHAYSCVFLRFQNDTVLSQKILEVSEFVRSSPSSFHENSRTSHFYAQMSKSTIT